jgi:hypothetical protein
VIVIGSSHDGVEVIGNVVQARVVARRGGDIMVCMAEGFESVGGGVKRRRHDNNISIRGAGYNEWLPSVNTERKEGMVWLRLRWCNWVRDEVAVTSEMRRGSGSDNPGLRKSQDL